MAGDVMGKYLTKPLANLLGAVTVGRLNCVYIVKLKMILQQDIVASARGS
jgi:hypothetical protein